LGTILQLGWSGPNRLIQDAVEAARKADVAVVFVGDRTGEGMDRESLALPGDQNALIEAVAEANPRTVVVLQTGGAVKMPWLDRVAGVMEMWYPGDGFGPAAARLLFGDAEPTGRLPVTFPRDERQGPAQSEAQFPGTLNANGALDTVHYDEGILVGYRFWDANNQAPLFPFGFGLSYTTFDLKGRGVARASDGGAVVTIDVRNTGARKGAEVVQVYVGMPQAAAAPPKQLKGFQRVELAPGEARTIKIRLEPSAFAHWDDAGHRWTTTPGSYSVMIGRSSRDIATVHTLKVMGR
jgi:beta-glucosidase